MDALTFPCGNKNFIVGGTWDVDSAVNKQAYKKRVQFVLESAKKGIATTRPTHYTSTHMSSAGFAEIGLFVCRKKTNAAPLVKLLQSILTKEGTNNWAAILQLNEETWWFGGVQSGSVLPGCDVYGSYDAVQAAWQEKLPYFSNDSQYFVNVTSPEFGSAKVIDVNELLKGISDKEWKEFSARSINGGISPKNAIAVALIVAIGGWMAWDEYQQRVKAEELTQMMARSRANTDKRANPKPWAAKPLPTMFISKCDIGWKQVKPFNAGWNYDGAKCSDNQLMVEFTRNDDWPDANEIITNNPTVQILPGGKKAVLVIPLDTAKSDQHGEPIELQKLIRTIQTGVLQEQESVNLAPDQTNNYGMLKGAKLVVASKLPIEDWQSSLDSIPTLRLTFVHYKPDFTSDIEGIVYAQ